MDKQNQPADIELANIKTRGILSSLWIFFFVNHFFMGLHEFANPEFVDQLLGGIEVSDTLLLFAAITIEIPIAMIVLSRVLPSKINWIANIVAAVFSIGLEITNNPNPDLDNIFFLVAELVGFTSIIVICIRWQLCLVKEAKNQTRRLQTPPAGRRPAATEGRA